MQAMSIAAGIPYALLVMVMVVSIRKGLHADWLALPETKKPMGPKPEKVKRPKKRKK
jgi:choline-glycine betaine transporter